jgi:hypothetical protein
MAIRSIQAIRNQILSAVQADPVLSALNSGSASSIYRLWIFIIASAHYFMESLFDLHQSNVEAMIALQKPHTLSWYQAKTKAFQFGSALPDGSDVYDNSALTDDQVTAQKIVKAAAATESQGLLTIKAAKEVSGVFQQLNSTEFDALESYLFEIKDAGVRLILVSANSDKLKLDMTVYYDPQLISSTGSRLDGSDNNVIQTAVESHLKNLPFNGELVLASLVDTLQSTPGIVIPHINSAQARRHDNPSFAGFQIKYQPFAGYLSIDTITVNYVANV